MDSIVFFTLISFGLVCLCYHFDKTANKMAMIFVLAALVYAAAYHNEIEQQFLKVAQHKFQPVASRGFE